MVERIDKPDAPRPYKITKAKESREDQHQQQNPKEDEEKRYQKKLEGKDWVKYGSRTVVIKPYRVPSSRIKQCLFRSVSLRSGVGTLETQIMWVDGRITTRALILLKTLDDFMKLKKLKPGSPVSADIWGREEILEIGIPQVIDPGRAGTGKEIKAGNTTGKPKSGDGESDWLSGLGLIDANTRRIRWELVLLYLLIVAFAAIAIFV
jgi:hypothetical protein